MNDKKDKQNVCKLQIKDFGEIVTGSTPPTALNKYWKGDFCFYSPSDFSDNTYCNKTEKTITLLGLKQGREIPINSVMVTCIASIGKLAINTKLGITNQQINTIIVNQNFDSKYIYYLLCKNIDQIKNSAAQTSVPIINKTDFGNIELFVNYNKKEQCHIAQILTTCDKVIEQTEAVIAKYKAIKQGMLHDLFTRGLDKNGKLRPTPAEAPEIYKESELGLIPKDWDVKRLNEIANINPATLIYLEKSDIVTFLKMEDVSNDAQILHNEGRALELNKGKGFTMFQENDILFAKITPCMENGKGALAKGLINGIGFGSTEFHVLRAIDKRSISYIYYLTTSKSFRLKAQAQMTGSAGQQRVSKDFLESYLLKCPVEDEQLQIGLLLVSAENKIICEEKVLEKYKALKIGLMKKLLTK